MNLPDNEFNALVLHMVSAHVPQGYDLSSEQTQDFQQMKADFQRDGRLTVNTGFSDHTIFGSASVNWAFRAWHDSCHLTGDYDFSPEGERNAANMQMHQIDTLYYDHPRLQFFLDLIDIEVNGQVAYFQANGDFPADQLAFTQSELQKRGYTNEN